MTKPQGNKDKSEASVSTTELSEVELEKATGGMQPSGGGTGKASFTPFSITRKIDKSSP